MTLSEVLVLNNFIKRKNKKEWMDTSKIGSMHGFFSKEEVLATDWVAYEKEITLTKTEFYNAITETMKEIATENHYVFLSSDGQTNKPFNVSEFEGWTQLAERLGF